jgi:phospholipid/cholesterol/gamma-HCH transport system permease protein
MAVEPVPPSARWDRSGEGVLTIHLGGQWRIGEVIPSLGEVMEALRAPESRPRGIAFDAGQLQEWDSVLLASLLPILDRSEAEGIPLDRSGLPPGLARLLDMARAVPERKGARRAAVVPGPVTRVGEAAMGAVEEGREVLHFLGESAILLVRFLGGKARFPGRDFAVLLEEVGAQALPIVGLISFLVGAILAFVGAVQLQAFGAQIFVADLVAIAVLREMGSMMTGIVLAGRTGASFAATLGTMTVNEEIDALGTMGYQPMEYLVLPRLLALGLMMPLLCIYANALGLLGGATVAVGVLGLSFTEYALQTSRAITMDALFSGLVKGSVYGVLVAVAGCMRGMQSGRSASSVGEAATRAAVTGIVFIILSDLLLTVIFNAIGF